VFTGAGINTSGVCVATTTTGVGEDVGKTPPGAVGVAYCPHRDAFPPHADVASKKEAAIKKLVSRFTREVR
jgi:hypothetical protein